MGATPTILAIVGPTAVGKTAVGLALARRIGADIISADSRQVYRRMDIGTAKPTAEEQRTVRHHLIDIIEPDQTFSAGTFVREAMKVLEAPSNTNAPPLIVGGAGLYLKALSGGMFDSPHIPAEVRQRIRSMQDSTSPEVLHERLSAVDPEAGKRLHVNDRQRVGRALEVYEATGVPLSDWQRTAPPASPAVNLHMVGLQRDRADLYARTDARVHRMVHDGLMEEVEGLLAEGYTAGTPGLKTFGYAEAVQYLQGTVSHDEAVLQIQQQTRRYAKRQMTWFRNTGGVRWINMDEFPDREDVCDLILSDYRSETGP